MLLNGTPFAFVIDLAALASRREYLKLDKWLTDKIREHGVSEHSWTYCLNLNQSNVKKTDMFCPCPLGAIHPGMCHISKETLPLYYGWFGPRERPAEECSTSS